MTTNSNTLKQFLASSSATSPGVNSQHRLVVSSYSTQFLNNLLSVITTEQYFKLAMENELFRANQLYSDWVVPSKKMTGLNPFSLFQLTLSEKACVLRLNRQIGYKLRAGLLPKPKTIDPRVQEITTETLFQRVKRKVSSIFSQVQGFLQRHPEILLVTAIIIVIIFLGMAMYSFSGGTTKDITKEKNLKTTGSTPSPRQSPTDNASGSSDDFIIIESDSFISSDVDDLLKRETKEIISVGPDPQSFEDYLKLTKEDPKFLNKGVPCPELYQELDDFFDRPNLPRVVVRAMKRIYQMDENSILGKHFLQFFTEYELHVLFTKTSFLSLPAMGTLLARNSETCVSE